MKFIGKLDSVTGMEELAKQLAEATNSRGRTPEQHYQHCLDGLKAEVLYFDFFGLEKSGDIRYDGINPETGETHEVKTTHNNVNFWTIPDSYEFFLKNAHSIDHISLLYIERGNVYLKYTCNAKTFEKYMKNSKYYNGGKYYNHVHAQNAGDCKIY